MKTLKITLSLFIIFSTAVGFAQDDTDDFHTVAISIPQVALVDIESTVGSNNLTLGFTAPTEAGDPLGDPTNDTSLWLNYSSIKSAAGITNTVSVKLDAVLPGVDINVTAAAAAPSVGDGTLGTVTGAAVTLTTGDLPIVSNIGSSYTGDGSGAGHNLTYSVDGATTGTANYEDLVATSGTTVTVTYTISDN